MKKVIMLLSACAMLAIGATSCQKENEINNEDYQFTATVENCHGAKTTLNGTYIHWDANDTVMIYGLVDGRYLATPDRNNPTSAKLRRMGDPVTDMGDEVVAIYPASLANSATSVTLPAVQVTENGNLISNFPMYASSTDNNLAFKNLFGALRLHLEQEGATVSRIEFTTNTYINGNFDIDNSGENPEVTYADGGSFTTTLICTTPQDISNGHDFFIAMPAGTYTDITIRIQNGGYEVVKYSPISATITIERSRYFTLGFSSLDMPVPPDDGVWGLFSVSATQQVWIASGNLQFNKTMGTYTTADQQTLSGTWRFAEHQYDRCGYYGHVGNVQGGNNSSNTAWIDLYGWATSGYNGYEPLPRSDYNHYVDFPTDEIGGTNYDWGVNMGSGWRTLTQAEWQFLVGSVGHTAARNGKCGGATVCDVQGLLLLPDLWNGPAISTGRAYTSNVYDAEEWAEMESYGAAFLPITGRISGSSTYTNHSDGAYWTTTSNGYGNTDHRLAVCGVFSYEYGITIDNNECEGQCAVRLCKDYDPDN